MRLITGTVVNGKVEVPPEALAEGVQVAILAPESDDPVQLTRAEEEELDAAVEELRRYLHSDERTEPRTPQQPSASPPTI